jgi:adenosylcobinamide kinase / adenosylcobinamide-phosphate guanylyltransferase
MGKITFILGGARSGKSAYALKAAKEHKKVAFVATCQPLDDEMKKRIRLHRKSRPREWKTFEESMNPEQLIAGMTDEFDSIVIDCLTLLVSNLLLAKCPEKEILRKVETLLKELKKRKAAAIIVSNEVGLGLVPENKLGRDFRDAAGRVNQLAAQEADEVFFTVSGIALKIK